MTYIEVLKLVLIGVLVMCMFYYVLTWGRPDGYQDSTCVPEPESDLNEECIPKIFHGDTTYKYRRNKNKINRKNTINRRIF